jgi:predicted TIM-barrel fold metal-dependent hydrolase
VDRRQLGWLFDVPDIPLTDIAALAARHPDARFVVLNGLGFTGSPLASREGERPDNCWIEISRLPLFISRELPVLLETLGGGRLLFGTGMPFKYPDPVLLKMDKLGASQSETRAICGENAAALLGLA